MAYTPTTWATGDKISSVKMNKLEQGVAGAIGKRGVAVVFGDSIFDCGTAQAPIKFANYLRQQNIYSEVRDFAKGGTGFGDTYEGQYGRYSLYEMLCDSTSPRYTEARQAVRDAEIIYMHLGGNDVMSAANGSMDEDLLAKITACFEEIFELNPAVIIKYVPFIRFDNLDLLMRAFPDYTDEQLLNALTVFYTITSVIEVTASNNVKKADITSSANIRVSYDGMHPDNMDAALNLYDGIVYGGYSDFSRSLPFAIAAVLNGTITDEYLPTGFKELMLANSTLNTKLFVVSVVIGVDTTFHMYDALTNTQDHIEWQTEEPGKSIRLDSNGFSFVQRGVGGETELFPVTVTYTDIETPTYTADKTFAECMAAHEDGKMVLFRIAGEMGGQSGGTDVPATFYVENMLIYAEGKISPDDTILPSTISITYTPAGLQIEQSASKFVKKDQGTENAGKVLMVGADGMVTPGTGSEVTPGTGPNVTLHNGETVTVTGTPTALNVSFEAPVSGTEYMTGLIFKAGNGFAFHDTAPSGYTIEWADEPTWTAGNIYEIIYRCLWVDNMIAAKWAEVTA